MQEDKQFVSFVLLPDSLSCRTEGITLTQCAGPFQTLSFAEKINILLRVGNTEQRKGKKNNPKRYRHYMSHIVTSIVSYTVFSVYGIIII